MWIKRRSILLAVVLACAVATVVTVILFLAFGNEYENAAMVVTWEEGVGRPLVVEGLVLHKGKPVAGHRIDVETGSGGNPVTTDLDGRFSVNVGELELTAMEVDGAGRIEWGLLGGPSTRKGVNFQIQLK